ncbi:PDZ domain-containing protein [Streptomyces sp. NPDC012403]|uniref:PDZ domain-containing protein n=1 Tax=unclassified Streptomyces TaxID=2593676 RepID=UPI0036E39A3C
MEQTALRPRPMPGDGGGGGGGSGGGPDSGPPGRRPGRRRGRPAAVLLGVLAGMVLVLAGAGLGAVGATVVGAGGLAEPKRQTGAAPAPRSAPPAPVVTRLGVEVADDRRPGALVVAVHVPGPGASAGLVRGDVLLAFGTTRVDSAADLARAVSRARPGDEVRLTVRHRGGGYRQLTAVPGIVT